MAQGWVAVKASVEDERDHEKWLKENCGTQVDSQDYGLSQDGVHWENLGNYFDDYSRNEYLIREPRKAVMFKLMFGGS